MQRIPDAIAAAIVDPSAYMVLPRVNEALRWLRHEMPLGMAEPKGFDPFWVVTKHADILEIARQNKLFHSSERASVLTDRVADTLVRDLRGGCPHLARTISNMDDPEHRKYRALTNSWFMPGNLAQREAAIRDIARDCVERMLDAGGECDFAQDVAMFYSLRVIMQILGVPITDEPLMLKLTKAAFAALDPDLNHSGEICESIDDAISGLNATIEGFFRYFNEVTRERRACPRDDLATVIANGTIDDAPIGNFEAMSYYSIVATAGHDTTAASAGAAVWALAERPEELRKLRSDPTLLTGLADEAVRWACPVRHFMRTAAADYELRGQHIRAGDWLMLSYLSGTRDEEVFGDPFEFRVDRPPTKQLAFGYGAHMCLGQHLARMEIRILFEELLPRIKSITLTGTPALARTYFIGGLKSLPVRFEAA